jgi:hypothetical protein
MTLSELKIYVKDRLEALSGITVYDGEADDEETFPYLCFSFPSTSFQYRNKDDRIMEIEYYNNTNDDTEILAAAEKVRNGTVDSEGDPVYGLDKSFQDESEGFYRCNIEFEGEIPTQEKNTYKFSQRYLLEVR